MTTSQEHAERLAGFVYDDTPAPAGIRLKLAEIIHASWTAQPFDHRRFPEDVVTADAILAAFPQLAEAV